MSLRGWLRLSWRLPALALVVLFGLITALGPMHLLGHRGRRVCIRAFAKSVLGVLGVRVRAQMAGPLPRPALMVGNHISWIDIFVVHAIEPATFIAKAEIARWPVIGILVTAVGTLYIDRSNRRALREVVEQAGSRFEAGERVMFFPEGTTGTGRELLPFHANLFVLAERHPQIPLVPVAHRYFQDGEPTEATAYVGEMTLIQSMMKIAATPKLTAEPWFGPALPPDISRERPVMSEWSREQISRLLAESASSSESASESASESQSERPS